MDLRRLAALLVSLAVAGCGSHPAARPSTDEPFVVATVAPLVDLVAHVMGERGELAALVPPGVDSHTYEPRPGDARTLSRADLFVANGLFLEEPALRLAKANLPEGGVIVEVAQRTIGPDDWVFDFSFPEEQGHPNPHLWMNVAYAMSCVEHIADALATTDPEGEGHYLANAESYLADLRELDAAIAEAVDTVPEHNRKLLTYHDSWPYFAARYHLEVVGAIQPADFSEPSAAEVRRMIEQIREEEVPAVFGAQEFPSPVLAAIAEETGVRHVADLSDDELPGEPGDPEHSYVGMMVANVRSIVEALGGDASRLDAVDPAG